MDISEQNLTRTAAFPFEREVLPMFLNSSLRELLHHEECPIPNSSSPIPLLPHSSEHTATRYPMPEFCSGHVPYPILSRVPLGVLFTVVIVTGFLTALEFILREYTDDPSKLIWWRTESCKSHVLRSELFRSIRSRKKSTVDNLLRSHEFSGNYKEINKLDAVLGMTPLEYAAFLGDQYTVMVLLLHGAEVCDSNTTTETRRSLAPIWWALKGSSESENGETSCQEIIRLLLDQGADQRRIPNLDFSKPRKRRSPILAPILLAAKLGYTGVVEMLLGHDCDHDCDSTGSMVTVQDSDGFTSLHHAAKHGHVPMVELLLIEGANIECRDKRGNTPLRIASREGAASVVQLLLAKGANIEARDDLESTPLHCAARYREEEVVRILLSRGASISAKDCNGQQPLHWAAHLGHDSIIEILLQHMDTGLDYDINEKDKEGKTVLHLASGNGHATVVSALLSHRASVKVTDNYRSTPLHYACTSPFGRKALVEELLHHGADIDARDDNLKTPLHLAVNGPPPGLRARGDIHVVKLLLEKGADFEAEDAGGQRPLHLAVPLRYLPTEDPYSKLISKLLLRKGARKEAMDRNGMTARELASEGKYWEVCKILHS